MWRHVLMGRENEHVTEEIWCGCPTFCWAHCHGGHVVARTCAASQAAARTGTARRGRGAGRPAGPAPARRHPLPHRQRLPAVQLLRRGQCPHRLQRRRRARHLPRARRRLRYPGARRGRSCCRRCGEARPTPSSPRTRSAPTRSRPSISPTATTTRPPASPASAAPAASTSRPRGSRARRSPSPRAPRTRPTCARSSATARSAPSRSPELARDALISGAVDLLFDDGISLAFWLNGTGSKACCEFKGGPFGEPKYFGDGVAVAVNREDQQLKTLINAALKRMRESGRFEELVLRYFPLRAF